MSHPADDLPCIVENLFDHQSLRDVSGRTRPDIEIDAAVPQAANKGREKALDDLEMHVRITLAKAFQRARQQQDVRRNRQAGDKRSADTALDLVYLYSRAFDLAENNLGAPHESLSGGGEHHA